MSRITTSLGPEFDADANESLLDAGLRAGVGLPYSCRTGRCSTCRCRARSGPTRVLHEELGLTAEERAQGWILACARAAVGDVALEVEELTDPRLALPRTVPCRIQSIDRLTNDVVRVQLRLPPTQAFAWAPGQYVDVIGPGGLRRSYSLANAVQADRLLELHVKRVAGGAMSAYWFERALPGDLLRLHGPLGTFYVREAPGDDLVFLATGTGIAPVKAMLDGLRDRPAEARPATVSVYWGVRTQDDHYWRPDAGSGEPGIEGVALQFIPVCSRPRPGWTGATGHVQDAWLAGRPDLGRTWVYTCGSPAMVDSVKARLAATSLPPRRLHSDAFVASN